MLTFIIMIYIMTLLNRNTTQQKENAMTSIKEISKNFLIEKLNLSRNCHTLLIGYLHSHNDLKSHDKLNLLRDVSNYRKIAHGCISSLRGMR